MLKMKVVFTFCLLIFLLQAFDVMGRCPKGHFFTCQNGRCIGLDKICNGQDDCGDGSDEICERTTEKPRVDAVVKAAQYILSHRQPDYGFEDFTPRALISLSFASDYLVIPVREKKAMIASLRSKLLNLFHSEGVDKIPLSSLAMNINALFATCEDPYDFHEMDLVQLLRIQTDTRKDSINTPVVYLALCLAQETRREDVDRLLEIYDANHRVGVKAMALIAMAACDHLSSTHHHYEMVSRSEDFINRFKIEEDLGSYSKALIIQVYNAWNYNATFLKDELLNLQDDEGGFSGLLGTYAAIPAVLETSMAKLKCKRTYKVKAKGNPLADLMTIQSKSLVQYQLEIPFGKNVGIHVLPMVFEGRISFYELMKTAEDKNPLFSFTIEEFQGIGKKVSSLAGIENDDESGLMWVLYRKNANKDLIEESGGLDYLYPQDEDVLVFKLENTS